MRRSGATVGAVAVLVVVLLVAPPVPAAPTDSSALSSESDPDCGSLNVSVGCVPVQFTEAGQGINLSSIFWGTTLSARSPIFSNESLLVNATPTQIVVWPGGSSGDGYDYLNGSIFNSKVPGDWATTPTNESAFVQWCRSINCTAILQVPGEIDNTTIAAGMVNYTLNTLHFDPAYWEIGNEPELWTHYDTPWSRWGSHTPQRSATPTEYADLVANYTRAMRSVSSAFGTPIRIIGIPSTGRQDAKPYPVSAWVNATVSVNGPNLSAIAYHSYPVSSKSEWPSLENFYAAINGSAGFASKNSSTPGQIDTFRSEVSSACDSAWGSNPSAYANCSRIQVFVTEVGSGLSGVWWQNYTKSFAGGLDLAAQVTEAMDLNVTNLDVFSAVAGTDNSWFNNTGSSRPDYTMFSEILSHLGSVAYPVDLTTVSPQYDGNNTTLGSDLYGVGTIDPADHNRTDLMLVNLNATTGVEFDTVPTGFAGGSPTEVWRWSGNVSDPTDYYSDRTTVTSVTPAPVATYYPDGFSGAWELPPQTVLLFETYPGGAAPVTIVAANATVDTTPGRWYLKLGTATETTNGSSPVTELLPAGDYSVETNTIPLFPSGLRSNYTERLEPFAPSALSVGSVPQTLIVSFADQWQVNVTSSVGGTVPSVPEWWNQSSPLNLTAQPIRISGQNYVFVGWTGWQRNSRSRAVDYVNLNASVSIPIHGWARYRAVFASAYSVSFNESGLPAGTNWSVTVRSGWTFEGAPEETTFSQTSGGSSSSLNLSVWNGTHAFEVSPVPGYRAIPANSSVSVDGGPTVVELSFRPITPPGTQYPVTFLETGLGTGLAWSVTVRGQTQSGSGPSLEFEEINGSFGYSVAPLPGYIEHPSSGGFVVSGAGLVVPIRFVEVVYSVIWEEQGLAANLSWAVSLAGVPLAANGSWVSTHLPNGSYQFVIPDVLDYVPNVSTGTLNLAGSGMVVDLHFQRAAFAVSFQSYGASPSAGWRVRLANFTLLVQTSAAEFQEPNGTYTFDIQAPLGYFPVPSHGNVSVVGDALTISVSFDPVTTAPPDPWTLAVLIGASVALAAVAVFAVGRRRDRPPEGGP